MFISHVHCKFRIVNIQLIILVTNKSPAKIFACGISLERIELVLDLLEDAVSGLLDELSVEK